MEKTVKYPYVFFDAATIRLAIDAVHAAAVESTDETVNDNFSLMKVRRKGESWTYDTVDELLADLVTRATDPAFHYGGLYLSVYATGEYEKRAALSLDQYPEYASVEVTHSSRAAIERVHEIFRSAAPSLYSPPPPPSEPEEPAPPKPRVFIGHGGKSTAWRDLKDHLADKHGYEVVAYETGARAGHTIRDILEDMLADANFAVLVMTAEDEQADGAVRARQNVVHEAGLFQGKLGFARAIIVIEEGVENLSNLDGVQYLPFKHTINETFGEVLATIKREFGS